MPRKDSKRSKSKSVSGRVEEANRSKKSASGKLPEETTSRKINFREKAREIASRTNKKDGKHSRFGDLFESFDDITRTPSQRLKEEREELRSRRKLKKQKSSKETKDIVATAVQEFWDSAWNICTERFFVTTAPVAVTCELRNAWLRIAEVEWQDRDMIETPPPTFAGIFQRDEPPLPLAYDSWSRGAIEQMPGNRRESVMDPSLRDVDRKGKALRPLPLIPSEPDDFN